MSKKRELFYLRSKIMTDVKKIDLLLDLISSYKIENLKEAAILASITLIKAKNIGKNNAKIGKILKH